MANATPVHGKSERKSADFAKLEAEVVAAQEAEAAALAQAAAVPVTDDEGVAEDPQIAALKARIAELERQNLAGGVHPERNRKADIENAKPYDPANPVQPGKTVKLTNLEHVKTDTYRSDW